MRVAHRMYEATGREITHVRQHMRQQRVGSDVERHTQAHIAGPLIQLAREDASRLRFRPGRRSIRIIIPARCLAFTDRSVPAARKRDVELGKHMTRRQRHLAQILRVPRTQDNPAVIGPMLQFRYHLRQLIHPLPRIIRLGVHILGPEMAPLEAVDGTEVADRAVGETDAVEVFAAAVAVPDFDPGGGEGLRGGAAGDEPEEFGDNGAEEDAFGC